MAAPTLIPVSEYLNTAYEPDCDLIDGELKERNVGERQHAALQAFLTAVFFLHRRQWKIAVLTEQRVQTSPTRFRVPDVCILRAGDPYEPIVRVAPLICIEILSAGQTLAEMEARVIDYQRMGVENVWIIDPSLRLAWTTIHGSLSPVREDALSVAGTEIVIPLADLFAELNETHRL